MSDTISFTVNGKLVELKNPDFFSSLNQWLRSQPGLTGTKVMCKEGGCGCCSVAVTRNGKTNAVNSCLLPLCSVDGCDITTIEGIGSWKKGYHPVQKRIHKFYGTQCGYCTPGFVVNMYSTLENGTTLTQQEIENKFDGNLCRCTGYRSILDAMKSFASDAEPRLVKKCEDIEDLGICPNGGAKCSRTNSNNGRVLKEIVIESDGCKWRRPLSIDSLLKAVNEANGNVELVCGNTGSGVFKDDHAGVVEYIDVSEISKLQQMNLNIDSLEVGAGVCLQDLHNFLLSNSEKSVTFMPIAKHIAKVASVPVRNAASWAGNLMLKHKHRAFQSDIFTVFIGAGVTLNLLDASTKNEFECDLTRGSESFLNQDMSKKIILSAKFPLFKVEDKMTCHMKTYKVMPRLQNAPAYVNAAFRASVDKKKKTLCNVVMAYGGVSTRFDRASQTERFLEEKTIDNKETLKGAINVLLVELEPEQFDAADVTCDYKKDVAASLLYKFYVSLCDPANIGPNFISAISDCERKVSTATQSYDVDQNIFPVSQPNQKLSSQPQTAGEAYYSSDRVPTRDELFACFVPAAIANADIDNIDVSAALKMDGCVDIIYKDNFPSDVKNTYYHLTRTERSILATERVEYAGQPIGLVVAESHSQATEIAKAVNVTYKNSKSPILHIKDAIKEKSFFPAELEPVVVGNAAEAIENAVHKIEGEMYMGSQYHMYMETQFARVAPTEDGGFEVESSTQVQKWIQRMLSYSFGVPCNKIFVHTKRVGGAYGGKATYSQVTAAGAALGAHVTNRPVRMHLDMQQCMEMYGMRFAFFIKYKAGVDDQGVIQGMDWLAYADLGYIPEREIDVLETMGYQDTTYACPNWRLTPVKCKTNLPSRTMTRCPKELGPIGMVECILEHIAFQLEKDPIDVKMVNLCKAPPALPQGPSGNTGIREIYEKLLSSADVRNRQKAILQFNSNNKWKKKGLALTPMKYHVASFWVKFNVMVAIYAADGTVVVTHGGIENGQGINVKAAQVAAYVLDIPLNMVSVHQTSTLTAPNCGPTGGSVASDVNCKAVIKCCEILASRIAPVREKMGKDASWASVISQCDSSGIDLCAEAMFEPDFSTTYASYGATASEVELDVLTGQYQIRRVDLIHDCGVSMNPEIDVGQAEGAFVMGLGFWLSEKLVYDPITGRLLTNRTWNYKIPSSKDIPEVWNIELLKGVENPTGCMRSKTAGEPPICMAVSVFLALKHAICASRFERGLTEYFQMDAPATVPDIKRLLALDVTSELTLR